MKRSVIVLGGGLAGLAAATFAAKSGHAVTLVEKSSALGGRAQTQQKEGFSMNLGAHALYPDAREILRELGVVVRGDKPPSSGLALARRELHTLPGGFVSLLSTSLLSLKGKLETGKLLASLGSIDPAPLMSTSVTDYLASLQTDDARALLATIVRVSTYASDLDRFSAGAAIAALQVVLKTGVTYVDGGWQTLVDGLHEAATRAGVKLVPGEKAARVERAPFGKHRVRLASGETLAADAVVIAASPEAARSLCPDVPSLAQAAKRARRVTAASLDVALTIRPTARARFVLGVDRPLYFSVHSAVAKLAPEGGAVVHAMIYGAPEDAASAERELDDLLLRMVPDAHAHTAWRRFLPSLVVAHDQPEAARGGFTGRASVRVDGAPGLFLAGDWVGERGLLAGASLASAREAARAIDAQGHHADAPFEVARSA